MLIYLGILRKKEKKKKGEGRKKERESRIWEPNEIMIQILTKYKSSKQAAMCEQCSPSRPQGGGNAQSVCRGEQQLTRELAKPRL